MVRGNSRRVFNLFKNVEVLLGVVKVDNKLNPETLRKIAKIRKETEKLRDDIKRLHEKIVQIKG